MELDTEAKEQFEQKFKIISLLGKGSFGSVYECQDKVDSQIYAVKVISKTNVKKSKIECLREEAKILSTIQHQNIVKVYEFLEADAFIYLKMELVKNGTLQKLIKKRWQNGQRFTDQQISAIMGAIFKGLNHIHNVSIIHRDIKPDNILLPNEEKLAGLKIADFGLSTKLDFHYPKTAKIKCGTMLFMAPQILCNYTYTKSVDIWSCAIIMHMLAHGQHPLYQPRMTTQEYKKKIKNIKFTSFNNKYPISYLYYPKISLQGYRRYKPTKDIPLNKHQDIPGQLENSMTPSPQASMNLSLVSKNHTKYPTYLHPQIQMIKTLITVRNIIKTTQQIKIPQSYMAKKQFYNKQNFSGLVKSKSKQSTRDINSLSTSMNTQLSSEKQQKEKKNLKMTTEVQNDNPTIMKLNSIFNNLFGKRSKLQLKMNSQGVLTNISQPKENIAEIPDISLFKEKIELELQRTVLQFKNNLKTNFYRKILPNRQTPVQSDKYLPAKDQFKSADKISSNSFKIRYRKKTSCKLYD